MDAVSKASFPPSTPSEWAAELNLKFDRVAEKTRIVHVEHRGPLRIQRPFYPEDNGTAHVYLIHPPGGVAGGDSLTIDIEAFSGARALITAPAANKIYRSDERRCSVHTNIVAHEGAFVEWLPQETIAFSGALADLTTSVHLEEGAKFIGWEVLCLGRPAAAESFDQGAVRQTFELWREETPLYVDRVRLGGESETLKAKWGLFGDYVLGTVVIAGAGSSNEMLVREVLSGLELLGRAAATELRGGVTLVRYVGRSVSECWKAFVQVWESVRPLLVGAKAVHPRIWSY